MFLGALLTLVGLGLIAAAIYVLRRSRRGWVWAVWLVITFVIACLFLGRGALHGVSRQAAEPR